MASCPELSMSHVASASAPIGCQIFCSRYSATGRPVAARQHEPEHLGLDRGVGELRPGRTLALVERRHRADAAGAQPQVRVEDEPHDIVVARGSSR